MFLPVSSLCFLSAFLYGKRGVRVEVCSSMEARLDQEHAQPAARGLRLGLLHGPPANSLYHILRLCADRLVWLPRRA